MTRCVMKDGEECTDMQEIQNTVYGKDGLKSKVSWTAIGWIGGATFASFVGLIFWFSDIRTLAKEFPKEKEKTEQHSKDIVKLDERTNMILSSQNKTNELLQKLIDMKQNDNAEKIASKELKGYNEDVKTN